MDDKWFKLQQKRAGVTAEDIAAEMGRDRSVVSRIYTGQQPMSLQWAQAFSKVLQQPLPEILRRAGVMESEGTPSVHHGFSEGDASIFQGPLAQSSRNNSVAELLGGGKPGVDVWKVETDALVLDGYLPGDLLLVDANQAERCRAGDVVIAQRYHTTTGAATTLLRKFEPPVLLSSSGSPNHRRVLVVDNDVVMIRGKVIASWRET
ncbi:MAG: helix-turn-helix transcriptional regulator [Pseudomonadota bacterium]